MSLPAIATREQWLAARKQLLQHEKELTRKQDALNTSRRLLPMVRIDKDYAFTGPDGPVSLRDLFGPYRQLIVQHVMFGPGWEEPCPGCSAGLDETSAPLIEHLRARDTTFAAISRAPIAQIETCRAKRGWEFGWYSSYGSDFNYDFHVTHDEDVAPIQWNFRTKQELIDKGDAWAARPGEQGAVSVFYRDGDAVLHTYTGYTIAELLCATDQYLDLTPLGRQDETVELLHHDRYAGDSDA